MFFLSIIYLMKITNDAKQFIQRHLDDYNSPLILIYVQEQKG